MLDSSYKSLVASLTENVQKSSSGRAIAMAGITREEMLYKSADAKLERGYPIHSVKSDDEDDAERNKVYYSYIDHELF